MRFFDCDFNCSASPNYKTVTSRLLRKEFAEELRVWYWKPYFWSMSYFIATVSERSKTAVQEYIRNQLKTEETMQ